MTAQSSTPGADGGAELVLAPTGTNYYSPSATFGGCPDWTWLTSCYTHNPGGGPSTQSILHSDLGFIQSAQLGGTQRLWAILDQGIIWDGQNYSGLDPVYLANLDDALAQLHSAGMRADLVLLEASLGTSDHNQFSVQALDGSHATLRASYLAALGDLVRHLAQNPTDAQTVAVLDLFNEAYYQLEQFGYPDATIHSWLVDLYSTAKAAAPSFLYTISDTTRLLKDAATWVPLYPVDVYDIHVYDDAPWERPAFYARGSSLPKPWFSGEAGCSPRHISCTYDGTVACSAPQICALSVDGWWLSNLGADGARSVLLESRVTVWHYGLDPQQMQLTLVGQLLAAQTTTPTAAMPISVIMPTAKSSSGNIHSSRS